MSENGSNENTEVWTTNRVIASTLFIVFIGLSFYLVYRLQAVVFLFFVSVVIGTALRPAVDRLFERGVLRPVGIIGIYVLLAALLFGFMALVLPLLADQTTELLRNVPDYYGNFRASLLESRTRLFSSLGLQLPANPGLFPGEEPTAEEALSQFNQAYLFAGSILKVFLGAFAAFLMAYYWALEGDLAIRTLLRFVPVQRRKGIRRFISEAEQKLGGFIRGQGILSLTVGTAAFAGYSLIGLPYALVLAILAGFFEMIPVFGPVLGAVPAILVTITLDPDKTVWVLVLTGLIQLVENVWLVPRVMNRSMGVNPILTLLALVTFGSVFGFAGAVLAIPLAAMIQLVLDRVMPAAEMPEDRAALSGAAGSEPVFESGASFTNDLSPHHRTEWEAILTEFNRIQQELEEGGNLP